jgi:fused signal recognition particle receptor
MPFNWFRRQFTPATPPPEESPTPEAAPTDEAEATSTAEAAAPTTETKPNDCLAWAKAAFQNIQQRQKSDSPAESVVPEEAATLTDAVDTPIAPESPPEPVTEEQPESLVDIPSEALIEEQPETPASEQPLEPFSVEEGSVVSEQPVITEQPEAPTPQQPEVSVPQPSPVEASDTPPTTVLDLSPELLVPETEMSAPTETVSETVGQTATEPEIPVQEEATGQESVDPLPLWVKAEAERKARLERLHATALDTEPESISTSVTPSSIVTQPDSPSLSPAPAPNVTEVEPALRFDEGFLWSAEVLAAQGRRPEEVSADEINWLQKLRQGLGKTRRGFVNQIKAIVGQGPLNTDAVMEIESLLLQADVGIEATDTIVEALQNKMRQETLPPDAAIAYLKSILRDILDAPLQTQYSSVFAPEKGTLNIWLMTGVNGAGKTTTIGKIAHVAKESGFSCLVAAADTFRAAAVEQVKIWAKRSNVEVIANPGQNTDPAAVVFDAITAAQSRQIELLLVDTAGRLQNKKNLMDELRKVRQVISKKAPQAKIESLLVLDATLGQNGLRQAQVFAEAADLSGVILTKLDGTAKGGVALAVVQQLGLPIRFIGAGEGIQDLRPFSSHEFVEALLSN